MGVYMLKAGMIVCVHAGWEERGLICSSELDGGWDERSACLFGFVDGSKFKPS